MSVQSGSDQTRMVADKGPNTSVPSELRWALCCGRRRGDRGCRFNIFDLFLIEDQQTAHRSSDEILQTIAPANLCFGCGRIVLQHRKTIKRKTIKQRRLLHRKSDASSQQPDEPDPLSAPGAIWSKIPETGYTVPDRTSPLDRE